MADIFTGTYTGDGEATQAITGVGFQPDAIFIKKETFGGSGGIFATKDMSVADGKLMVGDNAPGTGFISTIDADGFTVGTDDSVNASSAPYHFLCLKENATDCKISTYTGDGNATQAITGVGFQPNVLLIGSEGAFEVNWKTDTVTNAADMNDFGTGQADDRIDSLDADGFTVDTDDSTNAVSTTYYYVALLNVSGFIGTGSYTGNGSDDQTENNDLDFDPSSIFLMRDGSFNNACWWTDSLGGDATMTLDGSGEVADKIQSVVTNGFTYGAHGDVNIDTVPYFYFALLEGDSQPVTTTVPEMMAARHRGATQPELIPTEMIAV